MMDLGEETEIQLLALAQQQRMVLHWTNPTARKRVKDAEANLALAKENLKNAEKGLEYAHKLAEEMTEPKIRARLERIRKRVKILYKKRYKNKRKWGDSGSRTADMFDKWIWMGP